MATASAKDTFESETFGPNTFAAGTWRGDGVAILGGPFTIDAQDSYTAGAATWDSFSAGAETFDSYNAGAIKQEGAS